MIGLISGLVELDDPALEGTIIYSNQNPDWLKNYAGSFRAIVKPPSEASSGEIEKWKRLLGPLRPAARNLWRKWKSNPTPPPTSSLTAEVPFSKGFYEKLGCDVFHIPYQTFIQTNLPTVYNPHDLQHLHLPEFFSAETIAAREKIYRTGCAKAHTVVVASTWTKLDLIRHYNLTPDRIQVIPSGPPTFSDPEPSSAEIRSVKAKYSLNFPFAFYPAWTFPHKNHLRLLDAIAILRDQGKLNLPLVCCGQQTDFWPTIQQKWESLNLKSHVYFLGLVPREDLRPLYKLSEFVIIPTLFEGSSQPLMEAWLENIPAACSTVTCLPDQAGDAALLFDPNSVEEIAIAYHQLSANDRLRQDLKIRGSRRVQHLNWISAAKAYRAVYRMAAGQQLSEEDLDILSRDWMKGTPEKLESQE